MEMSLDCLTPARRHLDNIDPKTVSLMLRDPGAGHGGNIRFELAGEPQVTMRARRPRSLYG